MKLIYSAIIFIDHIIKEYYYTFDGLRGKVSITIENAEKILKLFFIKISRLCDTLSCFSCDGNNKRF